MRYDRAFQEPGYHSAFLTTFDFSARVFEDVVVPHLGAAGCRNIAVLGDTRMLNRSLQDLGRPHLAGRSYHLAKRQVIGNFHPKVVIQLGEERGRLMVGSANLTGPGLVGNIEAVATHRVTSGEAWAAPLLAAALEIFESHADSEDEAMAMALQRARARTPWLRDVVSAREVIAPDGHRHALAVEAHEAGIADALVTFLAGDAVRRLVVVSPFWDANLRAVRRLQQALGDPETALVVDSTEQDFGEDAFLALPQTSLHSGQELWPRRERRLHAKLIVVCGERSDTVLIGSANASLPGLYGRWGGPGNAEACLLSTQPAGSAIPRLQLEACLAQAMPLSHLKRRPISGADMSGRSLSSRDGGSLTLDRGKLVWRPPPDCEPSRAVIQIEDALETLLGLEEPVRIDGRWQVNASALGDRARMGRVLFEGSEESAPVPIAALSVLARSAEPPFSAHDAALIDRLGSLIDFGADALDIVEQLEAQQSHALPRPTLRAAASESQPEAEANGPTSASTMSREDFLQGIGVEDRTDEETLSRGPLAEMHRRVLGVLGLGIEAEPGADAKEARDDLFTNGKDSGLGQFGEDDEGDDLEHEGEEQREARLAPSVPRRTRQESAIAAARLKTLTARFCGSLGDLAQDPFARRPALLVLLLLLSHLDMAAPPGARAGSEHPLAADDREGGWIRGLGRLLRLHFAQWDRSDVLTRPIDEATLDTVAVLAHAAMLVREAAIAAKMKAPVVDGLTRLGAAMCRRTGRLAASHPSAQVRLEEVSARLDRRYARLKVLPERGT